MINLEMLEENNQFLSKIASVQGQQDLQEAGRMYTKTELLESAFSRAILPQEPITVADCQRNINDQSLYLIRDIEPDAVAVGVDNLGEPDGSYVRGLRYIIPIVNFSTKRFQITVEELRTYQYRITKRIEDKSVPILEKLEDKLFMKLVAASIGASGATGKKITAQETDSGGTSNLVLSAKDIVLLTNTLAGGIPTNPDLKKKELGCILMPQETFEYAVVLPGAGDDFGKDRVEKGLTTDTLFGKKIIRSIKSDIVPQGVMFAFTTPDFLGHGFALGEPTFEIRSNFGLVEWQTKESIGYGIGNALSVAALVLDGAKRPDTGASLKVSTMGTVPAAFAGFYSDMII